MESPPELLPAGCRTLPEGGTHHRQDRPDGLPTTAHYGCCPTSSGVDERMLCEGGHDTPRTDLLPKQGPQARASRWQQGISRKPKSIEFYPGAFRTEPDPNISSAVTTGRLVRRMLFKRWNREQILEALSDRANPGGLWLRCVEDPDDLLDRFIEGARPSQRR